MHCRGITLVEMLICLAVAAIMLGYAAPAMNDLFQRSQATTAINWALRGVVFARYAAVSRNAPVTLCPSRSGEHCGGEWHEGSIAFVDVNLNRQIDPEDVFLQRFEFPVDGASLRWRAFGNRQYLQMTSIGYTHWQNGSFVYCPANRDPRFARQLIINMPGRPRMAADIDGDGIVEDTRGRDIKC